MCVPLELPYLLRLLGWVLSRRSAGCASEGSSSVKATDLILLFSVYVTEPLLAGSFSLFLVVLRNGPMQLISQLCSWGWIREVALVLGMRLRSAQGSEKLLGSVAIGQEGQWEHWSLEHLASNWRKVLRFNPSLGTQDLHYLYQVSNIIGEWLLLNHSVCFFYMAGMWSCALGNTQ